MAQSQQKKNKRDYGDCPELLEFVAQQMKIPELPPIINSDSTTPYTDAVMVSVFMLF